MNKLVKSFNIVNQQGKIVDTFELFMTNGNHGRISNKGNCLFDGYYLEACGVFEEKRLDMKMCEMLGMKVIDVK